MYLLSILFFLVYVEAVCYLPLPTASVPNLRMFNS